MIQGHNTGHSTWSEAGTSLVLAKDFEKHSSLTFSTIGVYIELFSFNFREDFTRNLHNCG